MYQFYPYNRSRLLLKNYMKTSKNLKSLKEIFLFAINKLLIRMNQRKSNKIFIYRKILKSIKQFEISNFEDIKGMKYVGDKIFVEIKITMDKIIAENGIKIDNIINEKIKKNELNDQIVQFRKDRLNLSDNLSDLELKYNHTFDNSNSSFLNDKDKYLNFDRSNRIGTNLINEKKCYNINKKMEYFNKANLNKKFSQKNSSSDINNSSQIQDDYDLGLHGETQDYIKKNSLIDTNSEDIYYNLCINEESKPGSNILTNPGSNILTNTESNTGSNSVSYFVTSSESSSESYFVTNSNSGSSSQSIFEISDSIDNSSIIDENVNKSKIMIKKDKIKSKFGIGLGSLTGLDDDMEIFNINFNSQIDGELSNEIKCSPSISHGMQNLEDFLSKNISSDRFSSMPDVIFEKLLSKKFKGKVKNNFEALEDGKSFCEKNRDGVNNVVDDDDGGGGVKYDVDDGVDVVVKHDLNDVGVRDNVSFVLKNEFLNNSVESKKIKISKQKNNNIVAKNKKKEYIPNIRTSAYFVLKVLFSLGKNNGIHKYILFSEIEKFIPSGIGKSDKVLLKRELIEKIENKYYLTEKGKDLSSRMFNDHFSVDNNQNIEKNGTKNDILINKEKEDKEDSIVLIIDSREKQSNRNRIFFQNYFINTAKIKNVETRQLEVGDFLWIRNERVIDYIIERKTIDDFRSSVFDGRYLNQLNRLRSFNFTVIYLIEGSFTSIGTNSHQNNHKNTKSNYINNNLNLNEIKEIKEINNPVNTDDNVILRLKKSLIGLKVFYNDLIVIETNTITESCKFISQLNEHINVNKYFMNELCGYGTFLEDGGKNKDLKVGTFFSNSLTSIKKCTEEKAKLISNKYNSISNFVEQIEKKGVSVIFSEICSLLISNKLDRDCHALTNSIIKYFK